MPHRRSDWLARVKTAEREFQVVRIALDLLGGATPDEIHDRAAERGWDDLAAFEIYAVERHPDATYLIRMFSVFERAVGSFWRRMPGNEGRQVGGDVLLDEVGFLQMIDQNAIDAAQEVRVHRNHLVHQRIEDHAGAMTIEGASRDLLTYLSGLPTTWG